MKRLAVFFMLILFALLSAGCNQFSPQAVAVQLGPQTWIDAPLEGSVHPPNPVMEVVSHSADPLCIVQVELSVNGAVVRTDPNTDTNATLATMKQQWQPPRPGNYTLMVRAQNTAGVWGDYAQAVVTVQGAVATPTRTPTATPTPAIQSRPTIPSTQTALPPVGITFVADATTLVLGQCTTLRWRVTNASQVFLDNAPVNPSDSKRDCPNQTTAYTLRITTLDGQTVQRTLTVTIVPPTRTSTPTRAITPPVIGCSGTPILSSFIASPSTIALGESTALSWGPITNADSVEIDQGIGGVATPGSITVSPSVTTVYTLIARCKGVTSTQRTIVTVSGPTPTPTFFVPPIFFVTPTNTPVGVR